MKKIIVTFFVIGSCFMMNAQSQNQTDEMANLQKQVKELSCNQAKLERNMKGFMKSSRLFHDSIKISLMENDMKIKILSDSLAAKDFVLKQLRADFEKNKTKMGHSNVLHILLIILIIIVLIVLVQQMISYKMKNEAHLLKLKEETKADLDKTKIEISEQLTSVKNQIEKKN